MNDIAQVDDYYYGHDHLYSVVALFNDAGDVVERYEYDAYGKATVLSPNYELRTASLFSNPYLFTGRRLDTMDGGSLTIYHYRARGYDPETGRFMQRDPVGINPPRTKSNSFNPAIQYRDGINIYEYVRSEPIMIADPMGLWGCYPLPMPKPSIPNHFPWKADDFMHHYYYSGNGSPVDLGAIGLLEGFKERLSGDIADMKGTVGAVAGGRARFLPCKWGDYIVKDTFSSFYQTGITTLNDGPIDVMKLYLQDPYWLIGGVTLRIDFSCELTKYCCSGCYFYSCNLHFSLPTEAFEDAADPFNWFDGNQEFPGGTRFPITASWNDTLDEGSCI